MKKYFKIILPLSFLALIITFVAVVNSEPTYSYPKFPVIGTDSVVKSLEEVNLSEDVETVEIYKIKTISDPKSEARKIAKKLGFDEQNLKEDNDRIIFLAPDNRKLEYFKNSGGFVYLNQANVDEKSQVKISKDRAISTAEDFVGRFAKNDYKYNSIAEQATSKVLPDGTEEKIVSGYTVFFYKNLGGKTIFGGDRISIDVGKNGEITGAFFLTREYDKYTTETTLSPKKAFDQLKQGKKGVIYVEGVADKGTINKSTLGYWALPAPEKQDLLLPIYVFEGAANVNNNTVEMSAIVPAL